MKTKLFLSLAAILTAFSLQQAKAATVTVCNFPLNVAQYNTLQDAIDASNSGDTIIVQGSLYRYDAATVQDKNLTIIGPGWAPLRQSPALVAMIQSITLNGTASSGTEIQGMYFDYNNYGIVTQSGISINNIRIIRNYFYASISIGGTPLTDTTSRYTIEGNYFLLGSITLSNSNYSFQNSVIQNNVFNETYIGQFTHCTNVLVNHNLFYRGSEANAAFGYSCSGMTIQNNIFCRSDPSGANVTYNCSFKNNITFNTSATAPWTINGNANLGGNVLNQDPKLVAQSSVNTGVNDPLLNFTVSSPSPAKGTASDGKDMGLLYDAAGRFNWNNSRTSRLPYVFKVDIPTNTIDPNTTLNVSIEARRNN